MRETHVNWASKKLKNSLEDQIPKEVPKPFTVPPGYVPPTLGEQWLFAVRQHPYYRYGYAAALVVGIVGYALAREQKIRDHRHAVPRSQQ